MFVSFAHFTYTAHHRTNISGIHNSEVIVANSEWAFLIPDQFLFLHFSTYLGTIGVALFFITTGYLMPLMLERYTRKEFLLNRAFRIFPTLIVSVLITGGFVTWYYGEEFYTIQFLHSIFLTFQFWNIEPIIPVLWTLVTEIAFYLLCFILGRFTHLKLMYGMGSVALVCFAAHFWHLGPLEYIIKYILIILVGSVLYFLHTHEGNLWGNIGMLVTALLLWLIVFIYTEPTAPYSQPSTLVITMAIVLFFLFYPLKPLPCVAQLADIVYPLYLLHFTFGLTSMIIVKKFLSDNAYVMIVMAYIAVIGISFLVHYGVEKPFYFYIKQKLRR